MTHLRVGRVESTTYDGSMTNIVPRVTLYGASFQHTKLTALTVFSKVKITTYLVSQTFVKMPKFFGVSF